MQGAERKTAMARAVGHWELGIRHSLDICAWIFVIVNGLHPLRLKLAPFGLAAFNIPPETGKFPFRPNRQGFNDAAHEFLYFSLIQSSVKDG